MEIFEKIKQVYKNGDSLIRLIFINAAIFLLIQIVLISFGLFNTSGVFIVNHLSLPADFTNIFHQPWTILTYMFIHERILHILFNMIALYWFGKIFLMYFSEKQLVGLYLIGGFTGGAFYVAAFNLFPYFSNVLSHSFLLGASGAVMAIILATAMRAPNMELRLMFLGNVKLKYIAISYVLISIFGVTSNNAGGEIAHLGGALSGYLFVVSLRQGKDFTKGLNKLIDLIHNLFKPKKLKVKKNPNGRNAKMNDAEYNMYKASRMQDIDRILDKIKTSGYESLSADEKKKLFDQGKN